MMDRKFIYGIGVVFLSLHLCYNFLQAETKPVGFAIPFPDLTLTQVLSKGNRPTSESCKRRVSPSRKYVGI